MDRPFYPAKIIEFIPILLPYLLVTFEILFGTMIVGLVLGFFLARARLSKRAWERRTAGFIINAFRCTPSIVMLFMIFYGLPNLFWALFHVDINDWAKGFYVIAALGLLFSANMAEIMRASYLAVPAGQREAALTSGLTEEQAFLRILLP
ncbi:MAG: ABC transporter permease subunit, partial [Treponemataceae bacterium]|nr:ABC transporter permease subunit [Treponemataceae bacterium]